MRIPLLDMEMNLDGLVKARDNGDIELLPCPLTDIIAAREGLIFDGFYICLSVDHHPDAILCAYTYGIEIDDYTQYMLYDIILSKSEIKFLNHLTD